MSLSSPLAPPTPKVQHIQHVLYQHKGQSTCHRGSLTLTSHHLIFHYTSLSTNDERTAEIAYSLILKATRIPSLRIATPASGHSSRIYPITIFQKHFDSCALAFNTEADQLAVFDSLKDCAVLTHVDQLYAFFYQQPSPLTPPTASDSQQRTFHAYHFKSEFARQGVGSRSKAWRMTDINAQYAFCSTYPSHMVVPSRISDTTLSYAAKYRSKARIPALTYLHWANHASITRSSQPMVGLKNARSIQDEKLIEAIFTSHHFADPDSLTAKAAAEIGSDAATASAAASATSSGASTLAVYGATSTNLIIDARPTTNAMANVAKGAGTENMEYYKGCKKSYLGIDNIHVMRDSLNRLTDALRDSEPMPTFGARLEAVDDLAANPSVIKLSPTPVDATALRRSSWLKHIQSLLEGSMSIVRNVHINSSHVLIHCSDGWDRTSQLAAIAQICLDPYFRTFDGLAVLIEKDWLSFGHKFGDRHGLKGCEKYFSVASKHSFANSTGNNDDDDNSADDTDGGEATTDKAASTGAGFDSQAAANAFWGFTKQLTANFSAATSGASSGPHRGSHIKETSPVFHQFLDCMWQIMRQFPHRFEFDAAYLVELLRVTHECKFGTFLMDCERERLRPQNEDGRLLPSLDTRTVSAWTHLLSDATKAKFTNPEYKPELDDRDPKRRGTDMGVLIADPRDVRYFERLFGRAEGDMNAGLDREAEERRRARERLERAVRGDKVGAAASSSSVSLAADAEDPDSATIAVVEAGDPDPVLNPLQSAATMSKGSSRDSQSGNAASAKSVAAGVVDLVTSSSSSNSSQSMSQSASSTGIDASKLSYQARQPRALPPSSSTATARFGSGPSPAATGAGAGLGAGGDTLDSAGVDTSMAANVSNVADVAANRMKNLFIGGWGRLQEAMAAPVSPGGSMEPSTPAMPPRSQSHQTTSNVSQDASPWVQSTSSLAAENSGTLPSATATSAPAPPPAQASASRGPLGPSASISNPWATGSSHLRSEMEREHGLMRTHIGTQPSNIYPNAGPHDSWKGPHDSWNRYPTSPSQSRIYADHHPQSQPYPQQPQQQQLQSASPIPTSMTTPSNPNPAQSPTPTPPAKEEKLSDPLGVL
ncbi:phosphatases II [Testicularia cyperi]|uniref:Phosphatases II n=1 Tax=Testicularia cyperi TaxID=1882483 RepID=A0A317XSJ9_9BASI|nr:phosphatases II [Testicularia cyperi]